MSSGASLAVDIGGTFTDVVLECDRGRFTRKVLTTPDDPENGFMQGTDAVLRAAGLDAGDVSLVVHGTTLFTNALINQVGVNTIVCRNVHDLAITVAGTTHMIVDCM